MYNSYVRTETVVYIQRILRWLLACIVPYLPTPPSRTRTHASWLPFSFIIYSSGRTHPSHTAAFASMAPIISCHGGAGIPLAPSPPPHSYSFSVSSTDPQLRIMDCRWTAAVRRLRKLIITFVINCCHVIFCPRPCTDATLLVHRRFVWQRRRWRRARRCVENSKIAEGE